MKIIVIIFINYFHFYYYYYCYCCICVYMVCLDCSMMLRHHLPTWHTYKGRSLTRTCILISRSDAHLVLRHRTFHRRGWTWLNNAKHVLAKATFIRSLHPKFVFSLLLPGDRKACNFADNSGRQAATGWGKLKDLGWELRQTWSVREERPPELPK